MKSTLCQRLLLLALVLVSGGLFAAEQIAATDKKVLKAAVPASFPPYYQLSNDGSPQGFAIDVMNEIARRAEIEVEYQVMDSWPLVLDAVRSGNSDLIPNIGKSQERSEFLDFTSSVETFNISFFIRSDSRYKYEDETSLNGHRVATVESNIATSILLSMPQYDLITFNTFEEALFALISGQVEALAYPVPVAWHLITQARYEHSVMVVGQPLLEVKRVIGLAKGNQVLVAKLDNEISDFVTSERYREIHKKWFFEPPPFWTVKRLLALFAIFLLLLAIWRYIRISSDKRRLDSLVDARTAALKEEMEKHCQSEMALQKSEIQLRTLVESMVDGVIIVDSEGIIRSYNSSAQRMFGYALNEVVGNNMTILMPSHYRNQHETCLSKYQDAGGSMMVGMMGREVHGQNKDGKLFPIEISVAEMTVGGETLFSGVIRDISERKKVQQELIISRNMLQTVLDTIPARVFWKDRNCVYLGCNNLFAKDGGLSDKQQIIGCNDNDMPWSDRAEVYRKDDREVMQSGISRLNFEEQQTTSSGEEIWLEASKIPLTDDQGEIYGVLGIYQDITGRKQAELELIEAKDKAEKASLAKSEFLSSMSHELRTPLNAVLGFSQILELDKTISDRQRKAVVSIRSGGEHLLELINEVLDLASIEAGKLHLSVEECDLQGLLDECYTLMQPLTKKLNIRLTFERCDGYFIQADAVRFKQVVINYLSNAIKYNKQGGSVHLFCKIQENGLLRLSVSDTGVGLSKAQQERLFQPFERVGAEALEVEGAGVGLVISKKLMDMMGGSVGVESKKGVGSTFWLEIASHFKSYNIPAGFTETVENSSKVDARDRSMSILYIEDSQANLQLVREILEDYSQYHLIEAYEPKMGLELAQAHQPDLILLDINLPGMDGYQVLKLLRENCLTADIPVYAISANAMPIDRKRGIEAGFDEYISKPLNVNDFLKSIEKKLRCN